LDYTGLQFACVAYWVDLEVLSWRLRRTFWDWGKMFAWQGHNGVFRSWSVEFVDIFSWHAMTCG